MEAEARRRKQLSMQVPSDAFGLPSTLLCLLSALGLGHPLAFSRQAAIQEKTAELERTLGKDSKGLGPGLAFQESEPCRMTFTCS